MGGNGTDGSRWRKRSWVRVFRLAGAAAGLIDGEWLVYVVATGGSAQVHHDGGGMGSTLTQ